MEKAKTYYLLDCYEIEGRWYLPGKDPDTDGLVGTLKYSPDSITLRVQGSFIESGLFNNDDSNGKITILGFSNEGEHFSLFNCNLTCASQSYPGYTSCSYYVGKFYGGDFIIEGEKQLEQMEADFSFLNLDAWLRYQAITCTHSNDRKTAQLQIDMDTAFASKRSYYVQSAGIKLSEEIGYVIRPPKDWFLEETTEVSIRRSYRITRRENQPPSGQSLFDFMQNYRRLLTLLVGTPMLFSYIDFLSPNGVIEVDGVEHKWYRKVRMFYRQVGDIVNAKHLNPNTFHSILIPHDDIANTFNEIVNKWYGSQDAFRDISAAYISDLYLPGYVENSFLNCIKGLEAYHRYFALPHGSKDEERYDSRVDFDRQQILKFIANNVAPENQDYFIGRVNYEEESSFRTRLNWLLAEFPDSLKSKVFGSFNSKAKRKLISQVVDTRNYLTHRDNKDGYKNAVFEAVPLMKMIHQLSWVLQYFLLTELGIESTIVTKRLRENWTYED